MPARSLVTILGVVCILLAGAATPPPARGAEASRAAPSFSVRTLDGKTFRMSKRLGRPVVLDFWATWCVPCRASMPHLDRIQERYAEDGLVVLGLSVDEASTADVRRFAESLRIRFPIAMADEKLLDLYGPIRLVPTTFFVNRKGEMVRRTVGYLDEETLESYVKELF